MVYIPGGYSGFQVMGMIEWSQKSRPKKIPRASSKTPKNPWTKNYPPENPMLILWPFKVPYKEKHWKLNTRVCLFIISSEYILSPPTLFNTPKKSLLKSSYPKNTCQIFVPKKIPESKISNPKKSFNHPRHLKSQVPLPSWGLHIVSMELKI